MLASLWSPLYGRLYMLASLMVSESSKYGPCTVGCGKTTISRCDQCLGAFYCGRERQLVAWPDHKGSCYLAAASWAAIRIWKDAIEGVDQMIKDYIKFSEEGLHSAIPVFATTKACVSLPRS